MHRAFSLLNFMRLRIILVGLSASAIDATRILSRVKQLMLPIQDRTIDCTGVDPSLFIPYGYQYPMHPHHPNANELLISFYNQLADHAEAQSARSFMTKYGAAMRNRTLRICALKRSLASAALVRANDSPSMFALKRLASDLRGPLDRYAAVLIRIRDDARKSNRKLSQEFLDQERSVVTASASAPFYVTPARHIQTESSNLVRVPTPGPWRSKSRSRIDSAIE
jgi:hypothetical protein